MDIDTIATVLGIIGIGTIVSLGAYLRSFTRAQLFLRLRFRKPVDIVLTTSMTQDVDEVAAAYRRVLTSVGNLRAASLFSNLIGSARAKNEIRIRLSRQVDNELDDDLVVIGGSQRNEVAALFLERLAAAYPELAPEFVDRSPGSCHVRLGDYCARYDNLDQEAFSGIPQFDVGLIVAWINPFATQRRRGYLCAGFTSHGTAAAAHYLLTDLMTSRWRTLKRQVRPPWWAPIRRLRWKFGWPMFIAVVEVTLLGDKPIDIKELAFEILDRPSVPLDALATGLLPCDQAPATGPAS